MLDVVLTFILEEPNGSHQCIVTKFLGPSLAAAEEDDAAAKRFVAHVPRGLAFIYKSDVTVYAAIASYSIPPHLMP